MVGKRFYAMPVLACLVGLLIGLCGLVTAAEEVSTLVIGLNADPKALGAPATNNDQCVTFRIYSAMTQSDKGFGPAPDLAQSWEVSADSLTYTFHLNPDAKFHDGTPVTSEDVEFSIRARRAGYTIRYVPEARAWHKVGASTASRGDAFVWYYLIRNRLYTMRTHARTHQWLQFLVYFPLLCLWKSVWYAWHGNPAVASAIARGILDHLRGCVGETFTQESPSTPG